MDSVRDIDRAVDSAKPADGWEAPEKLENFFEQAQKELEGFDSWGIFEEGAPEGQDMGIFMEPGGADPDARTVRGSTINVRKRWLRSVLRRRASSTGTLFRERP